MIWGQTASTPIRHGEAALCGACVWTSGDHVTPAPTYIACVGGESRPGGRGHEVKRHDKSDRYRGEGSEHCRDRAFRLPRIVPSECCGLGNMTCDDEPVIAVGDGPPVAPDAHRKMPSADRWAAIGRAICIPPDRIRTGLRRRATIGRAPRAGIGHDPGSSGEHQSTAFASFARVGRSPPGLRRDVRAPHAPMLSRPAHSSSHDAPADSNRDRTATSWR